MPPITATRAIAKIREARAVGAAVYIYAIADVVVGNDVERRVKNTASDHSQENVGHVIKKPAAIWKTRVSAEQPEPARARGRSWGGLQAGADEQFINKWIFHPLSLPRRTRTLLRIRRLPDREFSKKFSPSPRRAYASANLQAIGSISLPMSISVSANRRAFSPRAAVFPPRGATRVPSF